jgi:hypothetical protein
MEVLHEATVEFRICGRCVAHCCNRRVAIALVCNELFCHRRRAAGRAKRGSARICSNYGAEADTGDQEAGQVRSDNFELEAVPIHCKIQRMKRVSGMRLSEGGVSAEGA